MKRQANRVYEAEQVLLRHGSMEMRIEAWQQYVDDILGSEWWAARWPTEPIQVEYGRRDSRRATASKGKIVLPPWARTEATLLHELAHHAAPLDGHGEEFCWAYLELVRRQLGFAAWKALRESFDLYGVRYRTVILLGPASAG